MENLNENLVNLDTTSTLVEGFEPKSDEKHFYIRGKFATIEAINNNKRFYPRHLWEREVARYQDEIKNGTINTLMEWDHPKDRLEVDPSKAIAKITKLWIEENFVMGEAVIFDVPMAETLKSMIKYGVQISVSSRARGRTDSSGVVQEFNLITFDIVAKPSDKAATMYGIFENEGHTMQDLQNIQNDELMEKLVTMIRTKDAIIDDLKEEINYIRENHKNRINEASIEIPQLDAKHDAYKGFVVNQDEENGEFYFRRAHEDLTQTHRHQDVALLKDSDPASSSYSGEEEILKIARLLQQTFGRADVVGTHLGRDLDTGLPGTIRGVAADVEEEVRDAEIGLDRIQRKQYGLSESFVPKRRRTLNEGKVGVIVDGQEVYLPDDYKFITMLTQVKAHKTKPVFIGDEDNDFESKDAIVIGTTGVDAWDIEEAIIDKVGEDQDDIDAELQKIAKNSILALKDRMNLDSLSKKMKLGYLELEYEGLNESVVFDGESISSAGYKYVTFDKNAKLWRSQPKFITRDAKFAGTGAYILGKVDEDFETRLDDLREDGYDDKSIREYFEENFCLRITDNMDLDKILRDIL